jgi:hypothetical protein
MRPLAVAGSIVDAVSSDTKQIGRKSADRENVPTLNNPVDMGEDVWLLDLPTILLYVLQKTLV